MSSAMELPATGAGQVLPEAFPRTAVRTELGPISFRDRPGTGRPIVLLHGIGSNAAGWRHQYEALATGRRVVGWDAPGYGESFTFSAEVPSVEQYAGALIALLAALGIERASVVGHSFGGLIAACAAAIFPARVQQLVLAACSSGHATYDKEKRESMLGARLGALSDGSAEDYARARVNNLLSPTPAAEVAEEAVQIMAQIKHPGFPQAARMVSATDIFPYLRRIESPTRVICGTRDRVTPPELNRSIADAVRGADFIPVEGAGHWLFLEFPKEFNRAVREFIQ
jgi:pimeloyl-ACP methyl ester carboxylesterase